MESSPQGSRYVTPRNSKRAFPGGSSSSGFKEVAISETSSDEIMPSKKKEVVCEIIDLDMEDVGFIDRGAARKGIGKDDEGKEPSGFTIGSAFVGHAAQDSADNQNGGLPDKAEQKLDEVSLKFELFKNFDTTEDCSDHFYFSICSSNQVRPPKNWSKRIQEEWKLLENNLPDTIFVRVYESRMDLLRAVIVGAEGTPYHDGLFFFDVLFPDDYPNSSPINPNLYDCGEVCLSLLNTWDGDSPEEEWVPGRSTMLQVLVSIQGLILNAEPYFNEPGYETFCGTPSGEQNSLHYNETTFLHSLQTMVYTMRNPPKHFEGLVVGHFSKHARDILVSCKAYLEGARVGSLVRGVVQDVGEGDKSRCSENFKSELAGFITTLIDTFSQIGAKDCQEFLSLSQKASGEGLTQNVLSTST